MKKKYRVFVSADGEFGTLLWTIEAENVEAARETALEHLSIRVVEIPEKGYGIISPQEKEVFWYDK